MPKTVDLNDIRLLMLVVQHGSFTGASRASGIPKSTISQRIAALEQTLGTGLLRRSSRSFSLTEAGMILLPHARSIEELARTVEQTLLERGKELAGTLRVSSSKVLAQMTLSSIVPRFIQEHSKVTVRVEATNRLADPIAEGYDLIVRAHQGPLKDSNLIQRVVARTPWSIVAAPGWISKHGVPSDPSSIPSGHILYFATSSTYQGWTFHRNEQEFSLPIVSRLISDDMLMLREAAIADGGVTCLPSYLLRDALQSGRLVTLLPEWRPLGSVISVLTPPRGQSSRLASAFSDFLAAQLPKLVRDTDQTL